MKPKRLIWQLFSSYLLVILASLLATTWYTSRSLGDFYRDKTSDDLRARATLAASQIEPFLLSSDLLRVDGLCKDLGRQSATRFTVVLPSGKVVGDSDSDPSAMDSHDDRPEIRDALAGPLGTSMRFSETLQQNMMYTAVPLIGRGKTIAIVRASLPLTFLDSALTLLYARIALGGLVVALLAAAVGFWISRRITRPLEEMKRGAERFAQGDLSHTLAVPDSQEIGGLAEALNQMAVQLDDRIRTVIQQHNELQAVLLSMTEGVLAVDAEERILSMNRAAGRLFGISPSRSQGQALRDVVRNQEFRRLIVMAQSGKETAEGEIALTDGSERCLQVNATALRDARGRTIGAVAVLNDLSHLRQLERIRRDFVANVSHEIRTPVTAIKGYVETLLDHVPEDPKELRRFLKITLRQADRLNAIIEDLLALARFDQDIEYVEIAIEEGYLRPVLLAAAQTCEAASTAKQIAITIECDELLRTRFNPPILEQAVVNLIDNAIKYSEEGSEVLVSASQEAEVVISVRDHGCGIEKEHLPRLFERFYRVDKARSRKMGGTGLGLAIVKHIAQAHGGRVEVQSTPGQGSVFSLCLPSLD